MTEAAFWRSTVRPKLGVFGMVKRIENAVDNGMPDTLYCIQGAAGLIELKHAYKWPAKSATPFHFNHFDIEQVNWIEAWAEAGGRCFVLAQIGQDYLLYPPRMARIIQRGVARRIHIANALAHGYGTFPTVSIIRHLIGNKT